MEGIQHLQNSALLRLEHERSAGMNPVLQRREQTGRSRTETSFQKLLNEKLQEQEGIRFSRHASERMEERGMEVTEGLLHSLSDAVHRAGEKGAKDTLVIGNSGMYIVNVPNKVVITAVRKDEMKENIFTNIDSAVWM